MNELPLVTCLMGPTASGKSALGLQMASDENAEIISVDSACVYQGMDIGSAKPSKEELASIPHHLIDIREPDNPYSAADFVDDALEAIAAIHARGKHALLVGGTMLYYKALIQGLNPIPRSSPEVREAILAEASELGWPAMHEKLACVDSEAAARLHPNDSARIERALAIYRMTGKTQSTYWRETTEHKAPYQFRCLALMPERALLHERIAKRFHQMIDQGFLEEVKGLMARYDVSANLPAFKSVGYQQAIDYLLGKFSIDQMIERGIIATRQLAKRQITWLRSWPELTILE